MEDDDDDWGTHPEGDSEYQELDRLLEKYLTELVDLDALERESRGRQIWVSRRHCEAAAAWASFADPTRSTRRMSWKLSAAVRAMASQPLRWDRLRLGAGEAVTIMRWYRSLPASVRDASDNLVALHLIGPLEGYYE